MFMHYYAIHPNPHDREDKERLREELRCTKTHKKRDTLTYFLSFGYRGLPRRDYRNTEVRNVDKDSVVVVVKVVCTVDVSSLLP